MARKHPYIGLPSRALWSRGVARSFDAADVVTAYQPLLRPGDRVASIGSCFASNLIPYIEKAGLTYVRTEQPPDQVAALPENLGYRDFSAAYGNVYTARQMRQLLERATGDFIPREDRWYDGDIVIDALRPGLAYPAASDLEFNALTESHLTATLEAFTTADVLVLTLGLTECWESALDGAVFPACPGTVAGVFDPSRHRFRNFTAEEVREDLDRFVRGVTHLRSDIRIIVTVSPVPLVATASGRHVLEATVYSKSVLRVAAEMVSESLASVTYFPAYELVTGPQAPATFFAPDRRSVTEEAVDVVMQALLAGSGLGEHVGEIPEAVAPSAQGGIQPPASALGRLIAAAECDEALLDMEEVRKAVDDSAD